MDSEPKNEFHVSTIPIPNELFDRLDTLIFLYKKKTGNRLSKHAWIAKALQEKIDREINQNTTDHSIEYTGVGVQISTEMYEDLNKLVALQRAKKGVGSKKQIIIDAITEKLDSEEFGKMSFDENGRLKN